MNKKKPFTPIIKKHGNWYVAYIKEVSGANTQGRTEAEARRNLKDAVRMLFSVRSRRGLK